MGGHAKQSRTYKKQVALLTLLGKLHKAANHRSEVYEFMDSKLYKLLKKYI